VVRGVISRFASATGALTAAVVLAVTAGPGVAQATPAKPTTVTIAGKGINGKLTVHQQQRASIFELLLGEVAWMANATPQTSTPKASKLGAKYVVTLLAKNIPLQVYELYPEAAGGPRAHRPARQPTGKKADGWFYGRLTMSEVLRVSGVPLKARTDVVSGGIGGGIGEEVAVEAVDPVENVNRFLAEFRRLFLLNGAVLVVILFGLAGMAFLIRRRV
jgi:hypothetical protein